MSRRVLIASVATTIASASAFADTPFTTFGFPATGAPTNRTTPNRLVDIYNVKDWGAVGNGSHDDTAGIRAALAAMYGNPNLGGTTFFPWGNYIVSEEIDIGSASGAYTSSRIIGAGRWNTYINGTVNNGFIFAQENQVNGPEEIAHLSLVNASTWVGSGALRVSYSSLICRSVHFGGMISVLLPYNIFDAHFDSCTGEANSDLTTGYNGTLGIAGYAPHISNWRSTSPYMTGFQLWGANSSAVKGCGIENSVTAILLGAGTGWASHCTVSGDVLTVGGTLGNLEFPQFQVGMTVFGRGLDLPNWAQDPNDTTGGTTIIAQISGTGYAGTYQLSKSFTISTPVPVWTYSSQTISGVTVESIQSEACFHELYLNSVALANIMSVGGGATPIECVNQFGVTGLTARCNIYVKSASATKISGCGASAGGYYGGIVIDPSANVVGVTFDSCQSEKRENNIVTATISNGSGGAGTILNVSAFTSGSSIGVGMAVTGAGVSAGTIVTGNHLTDPTLTGVNTTGTYRVNNSQNIASETMTVVTGAAWVMPTSNSSKTGLRFINCGASNLPAGATDGLETLNMTYTCLPGEAGSNANVSRHTGQSFFIVDAAKSGGGTATPGDIVQGGGTQKIPVFYDNTNWRYGGAGQFTQLNDNSPSKFAWLRKAFSRAV